MSSTCCSAGRFPGHPPDRVLAAFKSQEEPVD
jgi:hypothetical protein